LVSALIFLSIATSSGELLDGEPAACLAGQVSGSHGSEDRLGLQGGDVLLRLPRGELGEQPVQPVDGLDPSSGQFLTVIDQHPQRFELDVIGQHPQPGRTDRDHGDRVRVMGVGLAVVAGVEQPRPCRQFGRHVDHVFTIGQQPLGQRPAGAVAALDRPDPVRPARDVLAHRGIARLVGAEPTGCQHHLPLIDYLDRRRQLVGINPDEHLRHVVLALLANR
jgi:hypothetical protein